VQVRTGRAAGGADGAQHVAAGEGIAGFTSMELKWQYIVSRPRPWSSQTVFPLKK